MTFIFLDKVSVVFGFFKGTTGVVTDRLFWGFKYRTSFDTGGVEWMWFWQLRPKKKS